MAPPEDFGSKVASVPLPSNNYQYYQTSARQRQKQEAEAELLD